MNNTVLRMAIYAEKQPSSAEPGKVLMPETAYSPPGNITQPTPFWLKVDKLSISLKKGEKFRVVFAHSTIDCELRVTDPPLCADNCGWWSASSDLGPLKGKSNLVFGKMFRCREISARKWRFWEELPAKCRPKGNLILRVFFATMGGKDCRQQGNNNQFCSDGETKPCYCPGSNQKGVFRCSGGQWSDICECGGGNQKGCVPNSTQLCYCAGGKKGVQTCQKDGKSWSECRCDAGAVAPVVESVRPDSGPSERDIDIAIIGKNFRDGAKVFIGSIAANNVKVLSDKSISATVPKGIAPGKYTVAVENPDGQRGELKDGYTVFKSGCGCEVWSPSSGFPSYLFLLLWFLLLMGRKRESSS